MVLIRALESLYVSVNNIFNLIFNVSRNVCVHFIFKIFFIAFSQIIQEEEPEIYQRITMYQTQTMRPV